MDPPDSPPPDNPLGVPSEYNGMAENMDFSNATPGEVTVGVFEMTSGCFSYIYNIEYAICVIRQRVGCPVNWTWSSDERGCFVRIETPPVRADLVAWYCVEVFGGFELSPTLKRKI